MRTIRWWPLQVDTSLDQEFTGERFTMDQDGEIRIEHLHRYMWADQFAVKGSWIDAACGSGYGTFLLSQRDRKLQGFDIDPRTIASAQRIFGENSDQLSYQIGSVYELPVHKDSIDVIVSFETIEHVDAPKVALKEFKSRLRSGGVLMISSPNKSTYSQYRPPHNSFHRFEYFLDEFRSDLGEQFEYVHLYGQWTLGSASVIADLDSAHSWQESAFWLNGRSEGICLDESFEPRYFIALASSEPVRGYPAPSVAVDTFDIDETRSEVGRLETQIVDLLALLDREREKALSDVEAVKRDFRDVLATLDREREKAFSDIEAVKSELRHYQRLHQELEDRYALVKRELSRFVQER